MNPLYLDDDMLGVEPLELHFRYNKKQILSCSVELSNHTDGYILPSRLKRQVHCLIP
jgi:hypothetical protein